MKFYRENYNDWKVEFVYSPFFEMLCSLHVLSKPDHHISRLKWAESVSETMEKRLYEDLDYFGTHFYQWCSAMDFCKLSDTVNSFSIIEAIEFINGLAIEKFIHILLNEQISIKDIQNIINNIDTKSIDKLELTKEHKLLLRKPRYIQSKFISCLKEYYYLFFQDELKIIEPILVRSIKRHKIYSEKMEFLDYIDTLHERIEVTGERFHFHKYTRFDVDFHEVKKIVIRGSTFIDPHLLLGIPNKDMLELTIRVNPFDKNPYQVPSDLYDVLKALSEDTRLKILKNIYVKPNCTQSLAKELDLTEACISKHLKVLHKSGLVFKQRKGNYMIYSVDSMTIDRIPMDLYQYLDA